jgi:hypothetical protein
MRQGQSRFFRRPVSVTK